MSSLEGKVIIITGAAMGLGYAAAEVCAQRGAKLSLVDFNEEALTQAVETLKATYPQTEILQIVADVADEEQVKHYVAKTVEMFDRIDGFYNNAGIEGRQASLVDYDIEVFKKVIDVNLMGVHYGMRHVIPVMQKQQYGRIVNIASVGGIRAILNQTAYVASKHAVCGMSKNAALEYARDGVITNTVAPGAILTPMVEEAFRQVDPENPQQALDNFALSNPTKRLGQPEEVAKVVAFLLSEDCAYVNGQVIAIDGGEANVYGIV